MKPVFVQFGLLLLAFTLAFAFLMRVEQWPWPLEPGGLFYWSPVFGLVPMSVSLAAWLLFLRTSCERRTTKIGRWLSVAVALVSLGIVGLSELVAWDWKLRGSPTAMGNLEMIPVVFGLLIGWIGFGVAGIISLLTTVIGVARPANQRLQLTGDARD